MKIGITTAMSNGNRGYTVSSNVMAFLCDEINAKGVDTTNLSNKAHRGLDLDLWLNCDEISQNKQWTGSVPINGGELCYGWPKLVKPRGYDWLECYTRANYEAFRNSNDPLAVFLNHVHQSLGFLRATFGAEFACVSDSQFFADVHQAILADRKRFSVEGQPRTGTEHLTPEAVIIL